VAKSGAERTAEYRKRHRERYLEKHRTRERNWRATENGKRKKKNSALVARYGISIERFEELLEQQGFKCGICDSKLDAGFFTAVDHCHETGLIRGILCSRCNTALGGFRDNPEILRRAIEYVERKGK
jgi:hypothetical protein